MSSQNEEESDVQDVDIISKYTSDYNGEQSSQQPYQESHEYERVADDITLKNLIFIIVSQLYCKSDYISHQESFFVKQPPLQNNNNNNAENEEIVKSCMKKASAINEQIMIQRKQLKDQFKEFQNTINAARSNLKDYDMPYQTAHFPLYLKTQEKFVVLPAQNLNIRKGTVESFIKTNLENENSVKKAEQDKRVAFKQRRPYQRRKFDS